MEACAGKRFFKIMYGESISEKMRIPPKFVKLIWEDLSSIATLVGPSGGCWSARVCHSKGYVYIKSGWQEFQRDNLLKGNEMLVFTYTGNMRFHVQIFNVSGLERLPMQIIVSVPDEDPTVEKRKPNEEKDSTAQKRKRGRPRKLPISTPNLEGDCPSRGSSNPDAQVKKADFSLPN